MLRLRFFGGIGVDDDATRLTGPAGQRKRLALLALLAASPARSVPRERLAALLWPDADSDRARHQLSSSIYELRRALGDDAVVVTGSDVGLNDDAIRSDVREFDEASRSSEWERVVALYRGPFLDGFFVPHALELERWVEAERDRLAHVFRQALEHLATEREAAGEVLAALDAWRRLAAEDPWNARIALRFMEALVRAGDRAAAIRHAAAHAALLREEIGAEPDPEILALAESLRAEPAAPVLASEGRAARGPDPARGSPDRSIAVLPFLNLSSDPDNAVFAEGMTEEILGHLSRLHGLRLTSRTSVMRHRNSDRSVRDIARELDVAHVLEGSVRWDGGTVRITAQLIEAANDRHLWAGTYDRDMADIFAVQSDVARHIARALQVRLTPAEEARLRRTPTADLAAYSLYLEGRAHTLKYTPEELAAAIRLFRAATERDPSFAAAHAWIATVHVQMAVLHRGRPAEILPDAAAAARRAVELDSDSPDAHTALAAVKLVFEWDWPGVECALDQALALDPGHPDALGWTALYIFSRERFDEGIAVAARICAEHPHSALAAMNLGGFLLYADRPKEAIPHLEQAAALDPASDLVQHLLSWAFAMRGRMIRSHRAYRRALSLGGRLPIFEAARASLLARVGWRRTARGLLADLRRRSASGEYIPTWAFVILHHALGQLDAAFNELDRAVEERAPVLLYLRMIPLFRPLRHHPRMQRVLRTLWPADFTHTAAASGNEPPARESRRTT